VAGEAHLVIPRKPLCQLIKKSQGRVANGSLLVSQRYVTVAHEVARFFFSMGCFSLSLPSLPGVCTLLTNYLYQEPDCRVERLPDALASTLPVGG
jgi:hypothetical protein